MLIITNLCLILSANTLETNTHAHTHTHASMRANTHTALKHKSVIYITKILYVGFA